MHGDTAGESLGPERNNHEFPHKPIDISPGEFDALARVSKGYSDVDKSDVVDLVRLIERSDEIKARSYFTHIIDKREPSETDEGTIEILVEYRDGDRTRIGTQRLAFRKDSFVYDPADPDGPALGIVTAVRRERAERLRPQASTEGQTDRDLARPLGKIDLLQRALRTPRAAPPRLHARRPGLARADRWHLQR